MMEEKFWHKERVFELIKAYRNHEVLWNPNFEVGKRKEAQRNAWKDLSKEFKQPVELLKKKIKSLRTVYFSERKKAEAARLKNDPDEDIYVPILFYYNHMNFLSHIKKSKDTSCDVSRNSFTDEYFDEDSSAVDMQIELQDHNYPREIDIVKVEDESSDGPPSISSMSFTEPPTKIRIKSNASSHICNSNCNSSENPGKLPVICRVWGEKLMNLDCQQRLFAEKAINDILFEASQGNLVYNSSQISSTIQMQASKISIK